MSCQEEQGETELLSETQYNMDVNRGREEEGMAVRHPSMWAEGGQRALGLENKLSNKLLVQLSDILYML